MRQWNDLVGFMRIIPLNPHLTKEDFDSSFLKVQQEINIYTINNLQEKISC